MMWLVVAIIAFVVLTSVNDKDSKKTGFSCSSSSGSSQTCYMVSNEPNIIDGYSDYQTELENIMTDSITDTQGDEVNIMVKEHTSVEDGVECVIVCDEQGDTGMCWEHRGMGLCQYSPDSEYGNLVHRLQPLSEGTHYDVIQTGDVIRKTNYKGVPYFVFVDDNIFNDPNGIYFRTLSDGNMFIQFSAQLNDNIIKNYIDKFYTEQCS